MHASFKLISAHSPVGVLVIKHFINWAALGVAVSLAATASQAEPYAISHTGTQSDSEIPGITTGESYELTFVFDNGGTTASSQTWSTATLQCVIWKFNTARNVVYTQDVTVNTLPTGPEAPAGTVTTDAAGVLQTNFTDVIDTTAGGAGSTLVGAAFATDAWFANNFNGIFFTVPQEGLSDFTPGGVPMAAAEWSNPTPFSGDCAGRMLGAPPVAPAPVPTLSEWALILMGLILAAGAVLMIQRRKTVA